ncbi:GntR family transcriptional regulator [Paralcaligenes ginsengisoli]
MRADDSVLSPANAISRYFFRLGPLGLSKHAQLRESIIQAVNDGQLRYQDKLPPEKALGDLLSISLGTTQKALGTLAAEGYLVRKHGIGTFIGQPRRAIQKSWHYRFTDPATGEHLPVFAHLIGRTVVGDGPWTKTLGPDAQGYIRIDRRISIDERFACVSELYLPKSLFEGMLDIPAARLEDVNLKEILEMEFGYPTVEAKGGARLVRLEPRIAMLMDLAPGSWALKINIHGKTRGQQPISYQKMFVPPSDCELDMDFTGAS